MRSTRMLTALGVVLGLALATSASAEAPLLKNAATGNPNLQSIEAISFGPQGLLLIGDGRGSQVVAVDTGDTTPQPWSQMEMKGIKDQLAGRVGTTGKGIEIQKMVVNPASQKAYFAVRILSGKKDLILTVDGAGKINEFVLDSVKHTRVPLPTDKKVTKITDITWAGDRVLVAAQANEEFGSKIFSISGDNQCSCFSTETYHVAHGRWETKAPIRTVIPYEEGGKKYVVGAFTCTPVVKYPIEDLKPEGKVKGVSVIELGNGNTPQDMFVYEKDGKKYILMSTLRMSRFKQVGPSPYWTARIDYDILREADKNKINENALRRVKSDPTVPLTDRAQVAAAFHGVAHMDRLDNGRALVVRTDSNGNMDLAVLGLP